MYPSLSRKRSYLIPLVPRILISFLITVAIVATTILMLALPHTTHQARGAAAKTPLDVATAATIYGHNINGGQPSDAIAISEDLNEAGDSYVHRQEIMEDCFAIQKALWQRFPHAAIIQVIVQKPREGGGMTIIGGCSLKQAKAHYAPWDHLDYVSGWQIYDYKGFAPSVRD